MRATTSDGDARQTSSSSSWALRTVGSKRSQSSSHSQQNASTQKQPAAAGDSITPSTSARASEMRSARARLIKSVAVWKSIEIVHQSGTISLVS
eukprot:2681878-Prymnesium_polylepis.1